MAKKEKPKIRLAMLETTYVIWMTRPDGVDNEIGTIRMDSMGGVRFGKKTNLMSEEMAEVLRQLPKVEEEE